MILRASTLAILGNRKGANAYMKAFLEQFATRECSAPWCPNLQLRSIGIPRNSLRSILALVVTGAAPVFVASEEYSHISDSISAIRSRLSSEWSPTV